MSNGLRLLALCVGLCTAARADLIYERATRITGGTVMRYVQALPSGDALKEPKAAAIRIRGRHLSRLQGNFEELFDLDKRTVTTLDHEHKSYTVESFDEYRGAHPAPVDDSKAEYSVEVSHNGETRQFYGVTAREVTIRVTVDLPGDETKHAKPLEIAAQGWFADEAPGWASVAEATKKIGEELDVDLLAPDLAITLKPAAREALRRMTAETLNLSGAVLEQTVRINGPAASALDPKMLGKAAKEQAKLQAGEAALSKLGRGIGGILRGGAGGAISSGPAGNVPVPDKSPVPKIGRQGDPNQEEYNANAVLELQVKTTKYANAEMSDDDFAVPHDYVRSSAAKR